MGQGVFLRKYGVEATFNFDLFEIDGVDFKVDAAHAANDTMLMKDEGAETATDNAFADEGQGYSIVLTATEMEFARGKVYVVDQGTKAWLDTSIVIETYGNASAQHAVDLDDAVRAGLAALPNAAADAAGGIPLSSAGSLEMDTLADWVDGARLDLILDIIAADTTTDIPALIATAQADLDLLTGADGATLASAQGNYAPGTAAMLTIVKKRLVNQIEIIEASGDTIIREDDDSTAWATVVAAFSTAAGTTTGKRLEP